MLRNAKLVWKLYSQRKTREISCQFFIIMKKCLKFKAEFLLPTRRTPPAKPQHGVDFLGPLWLSRTYKITCCRRGSPVAENPQLVSNWTETASDYAVDEKLVGTEQDDHCRVFQVLIFVSCNFRFPICYTWRLHHMVFWLIDQGKLGSKCYKFK